MRRALLLTTSIVALMSSAVEAQGPQSLLVVPNLTALRNLPSTQAHTVTRLGFGGPNDGGQATYTASGTACSRNTGNGDDGSQVKSADGKCFLATFPNGEADVRVWGASSAGDVSVQLNAAATAAAAEGLKLMFPGLTFSVCANPFQPPNFVDIYGQANKTRIQTQIGCISGGALAKTVELPAASLINPSLVWGRMHDIIIDGYGLTQFPLFGQFVSYWAFPGVTVRNAKPATVQTVTTSALTAVGSKVLTLSSARAVFQNATIVDDLSRPTVIAPGNVIRSCTPSCAAATSITIDQAVTSYDDGAGVASGDTLRLIDPTANVYFGGGEQVDLSQNFNIHNINDAGRVGGDIYVSQTTLPMACIYLPGFGGFSSMADSLFDGMTVVNCMYGVIDPYGLGNSFGKHFHAWGQPIFGASQPYDLRMQYGLAVGGADWIKDWDVDDAMIAAVFVAKNTGIGGVAGTRVIDGIINLTQAVAIQNRGIILQSGLAKARIEGNQDLQLATNGFLSSIIYQVGTADPTTIVKNNFDALYTTVPVRMTGSAVGVTLSTTPTYLGPTGASAVNANGWLAPCTGYVTGHVEGLLQGGALAQNVTFTIADGGFDITGTAQTLTAGAFSAGYKTPPTNNQLMTTAVPVAAGDDISLKAVAASGTPVPNLSYTIYQVCRQGS